MPGRSGALKTLERDDLRGTPLSTHDIVLVWILPSPKEKLHATLLCLPWDHLHSWTLDPLDPVTIVELLRIPREENW
jgi:hypothetical protein